jgi:hypothetical protein
MRKKMSPLNLHPEEELSAPKKKKNKTLKVMLGIAALIAIPVVGTTLAASISINSDDPIQFGQGVQRAVVCDNEVTLTANAVYANAENAAGTYTLGSVVLSDIDFDCGSKQFEVSVYDNTANSSALATCIIESYAAADGTTCDTGSTADLTWSSNFDSQDEAGIAFTLTIEFGALTSKIPSADVYNITVQTS